MKVFRIDRAALGCRIRLSLAGAWCEFATNSPGLLSTLSAWHCMIDNGDSAQFTMDISVTAGCSGSRQRPHFRGLHHIVVACFGESDVFVFDLLRRTVCGVVSETTAQDARFWNATMLPIAVGVLGATVGVLPVHCACLSNYGEGLLIAGVSGAGKSTLSVALTQHGFDFVSDDWTYLSDQNGRLLAHGMSAPVKLLPDAVRHFPLLAGQPLRRALNGELAYEVGAESNVGARVISRCRPRRVIFLERSAEPMSELISASATQTQAYLEASVEPLPPQLTSAAEERAALMMRLAGLPCWTYRYGGTPQFAARELQRLFPVSAGEAA